MKMYSLSIKLEQLLYVREDEVPLPDQVAWQLVEVVHGRHVLLHHPLQITDVSCLCLNELLH